MLELYIAEHQLVETEINLLLWLKYYAKRTQELLKSKKNGKT